MRNHEKNAAVCSIANYGNRPYLSWVWRCNASKKEDVNSDPAFAADGMGLAAAPPVADDATSRREAYYDPMNFAPDVRCAILMSAGLIDPVSPPVSVFAVYHRLGTAKKTMVPLDGLGHDWSAEFDRHAWRWLDGVLGIAPGAAKNRQ